MELWLISDTDDVVESVKPTVHCSPGLDCPPGRVIEAPALREARTECQE